MPLSQLVSDATSVVDGVLNAFGLSDPDTKYPASLGKQVSNTIVENDKSWRKSLGYQFEVVRVKNGEIKRGPSGANPSETWKPFVLQINPQELSQDEIFAIEVTPTFSGVLVEHQGTTLKDISISGTTGLSPNRREGGSFPQSGRPVFAAGHSGYYEFHELRTYFRAYVEQKRNDPGKDEGELRMVWRNLRDHEDLFVEPQKFTMKRSASKPHLYEYQIALKGIGIAVGIVDETDWLSAIDNFIEDVQDGLDTGVKLIQGGIGFIERAERDISNTLLGPVRSIAAAMRELKTGKQRLRRAADRLKNLKSLAKKTLDVGKLITPEDKKKGESKQAKEFQSTYEASVNKAKEESDKIKGNNKAAAEASQAINKEKVKALAEKAQEIYDNLADLAGVDTAAYNAAKGKTATLSAEVVSNQQSYETLKALYAVNVVKKALDKMTATDALFKQSTKADSALVAKLYDEAKKSKENSANLILKNKAEIALSQAKISGDQSALKTIQDAQKDMAKTEGQKIKANTLAMTQAQNAKTIELSTIDNIQTIAAKYLGNPDKFKDLVVYNGLKPPYIDPTPLEDDPVRVPGVLRPGDNIFIPTSGSGGRGFGVVRNDDYPIVQSLPEIEKNFGVDIQLTDDFDIMVSSTGDVKMVGGTQNVAQGLVVKLLLENGALQRHPEIGGGLSIGVKALQISETMQNVRRSLEKDGRVQRVIFADIKQEGPKVMLNLVLKLKNIDQPVAIPVKVA